MPGDSAWAQPHVKSPSNPQQAPVDSLSRLSASETHHWPHRPNEQDVQTPVDWGEDLSLHEDPSAPVSAYKQRPDGTGPSDGRAAAPSDLPQGSLGDDSSGEHRDRMSEMRQQLWAPSSRSQISDGSERLEPEVNQFDPTNRSFMMQLLHMDETGELARLYQAEEVGPGARQVGLVMLNSALPPPPPPLPPPAACWPACLWPDIWEQIAISSDQQALGNAINELARSPLADFVRLAATSARLSELKTRTNPAWDPPLPPAPRSPGLSIPAVHE